MIGYRPQLARSGNGFVCGQLVPWGNAADAAMLQPLVERVVGATGVTPETVGTDDGYASDANLRWLKETIGVKDVSFGEAKGRKVMGDSDWTMPYMAAARAGRWPRRHSPPLGGQAVRCRKPWDLHLWTQWFCLFRGFPVAFAQRNGSLPLNWTENATPDCPTGQTRLPAVMDKRLFVEPLIKMCMFC